ncbi:MAG: beta-ketoacyl-[acyl-carrier-protein] synthase family protein [Candidatus Aminicenantes bacterium]|nr:beta-ketoacyl-[acyl-carrier-protein] synthase family protein [Candidatus Aminicenantes bacterium]
MRRVVVTGCGVVSAIGRGRESFFTALQNGASGIGPISHFDASAFPVRQAAEVKGLKLESLISRYPEAADITDRKVFLALAAFDDLMADARMPARLPASSRMGLNLGVSLEILPLERLSRPATGLPISRIDHLRRLKDMGGVLQTPLDTASRILAARHDMTGPSYVNCSACAASAMAIGHSFELIRRGLVDIVCCGGYDSMVNPLGIGGFALLGALSTNGENDEPACRPFDARRNGTVIGEGAGLVTLEDLGHAKSRNAPILAEVAGYGASLDAYKPTDPDPDGRGMLSAMKKALAGAGIGPGDIDYINAHGTSTPKNDEIETRAIKDLFGDRAYRIPVSSTKSMIGHLIGAAGAVELIACLAGFLRGFVPPTINYAHPDPFCDLDYVPNQAREWDGEYILTNSFGFGGQNATLVLKRYREEP